MNFESFKKLRKAVVHNDANENNIIVTRDLKTPKVTAIIDFGDAYYEEEGQIRNWFHEQFLDDCINSWNPDFK